MAAIAFTESALHNVKRGLRDAYPNRKSANLSEALAAALGYRTHAALRAALDQANNADPQFVLLDSGAFARRLHALDGGYEPSPADFACFDSIEYPDPKTVIRTKSRAFYKLKYNSVRNRAWRNIMVATVNAGIEQGLFTIRPGDNRWEDDPRTPGTQVFRFTLAGVPAVGSVSDAGYDELNVHGALWPTAQAERWIGAYGANFNVGEAVAYGWLERRDGAWIQYNGSPEIHCRRTQLKTVAAFEVKPKCFDDRGDFKM